MKNKAFERIDKIVNAYLIKDYDKVLSIIGIEDDFDFASNENVESLDSVCNAVTQSLCGSEEETKYFLQRIEEIEENDLKCELLELLSYTNQFDKMKEYLDDAQHNLKGKDCTKSALLSGLARSPKYRTFVKELIKSKKDILNTIQYPEFYIARICAGLKDTEFCDNIIRESLEKRLASNKNNEPYYDFGTNQIVEIIRSTRNPEYIKRCYYDKELCTKSGFRFIEMCTLAAASKDSDIIEECIRKSKDEYLEQEELIHLIVSHQEKSFVLDAIFNPQKYGVEFSFLPLLIRLSKMPTEDIKDLSIFATNEGKVALALYSGDSSVYKSNYKLIDRKIFLPKDMTLGLEIECTGYFSQLIHKTKALCGWRAKNDGTIMNNEDEAIGVEVVSPILTGDSEEVTKSVVAVMETLKEMGQYSNYSCGGHIHIGANYIKMPQAFRNLLELWYNNEKIIYLISNKAGELPREAIFEHAKPESKEAEDNIDSIILLNNEEDIDRFKQKIGEQQKSRYRSLNFKNMCLYGINTLEDRISNNPEDTETCIDNINLAIGFIKTAQDLAVIQSKKTEERTPEENERLAIFDRLGKDNKLTEAKRAELLINLVIEEEELRPVYYERYEVNRELLDQDPKLEKDLDCYMSHTLIRYSDKDSVGKMVFAGEDPITGDEYKEISEYIGELTRDDNLESPDVFQ